MTDQAGCLCGNIRIVDGKVECADPFTMETLKDVNQLYCWECKEKVNLPEIGA